MLDDPRNYSSLEWEQRDEVLWRQTYDLIKQIVERRLNEAASTEDEISINDSPLGENGHIINFPELTEYVLHIFNDFKQLRQTVPYFTILLNIDFDWRDTGRKAHFIEISNTQVQAVLDPERTPDFIRNDLSDYDDGPLMIDQEDNTFVFAVQM